MVQSRFPNDESVLCGESCKSRIEYPTAANHKVTPVNKTNILFLRERESFLNGVFT